MLGELDKLHRAEAGWFFIRVNSLEHGDNLSWEEVERGAAVLGLVEAVALDGLVDESRIVERRPAAPGEGGAAASAALAPALPESRAAPPPQVVICSIRAWILVQWIAAAIASFGTVTDIFCFFGQLQLYVLRHFILVVYSRNLKRCPMKNLTNLNEDDRLKRNSITLSTKNMVLLKTNYLNRFRSCDVVSQEWTSF